VYTKTAVTMPIDYSQYPPYWQQFSAWIRHHRAGGRCECTGQCGLHQPNPHPRRCTERNKYAARWARGRVILTVAHLCTCSPPCARPAHVIAACQRCHLRIDSALHAAHRRDKKSPTGVAKSTAPLR
jgi:hypothetical protein